ncbi:MAG: cytochrome c oxidase subunit II [Rickettsiales bacterium]
MQKLSFWQFQNPCTEIMKEIIELYYFIMLHMSFIVFAVIGCLIYIIFKFNSKKNHAPAQTNLSLKYEMFIMLIPICIIISIAIPSILLIKKIDTPPLAEFSIKIIGHQWFWRYEYINHNNITFDSYILQEQELTTKDYRLLSVDNKLIIPENTTVRLIGTSNDVIHSFGIPSAGIKMDCIPGRLNETWIHIKEKGIYYGQCYELCGANHAFMPIAIEVVTKEEFKNWIRSKNLTKDSNLDKNINVDKNYHINKDKDR